jgi:4-hydroxy-tetrahydrodipicolinate reductase
MASAGASQARVLVCGLGPIGHSVARLLAAEGRLAAVADIEPAALDRARRELGGIPAHGSVEDALAAQRLRAVALCTRSSFLEIIPDLRAAIAAGASVVTSCEEACWPFSRYPEAAAEVDREARARGAAILGAGINPGFLMDILPAIVAAPFGPGEQIVVTRRVDAASRRRPLQEKIGVGLSVEKFLARRESGGIGHRGLEESLWLLGAGLGIAWDEVQSGVEPVIAARSVETPLGDVPAGGVIGMHNRGFARRTSRGREIRAELDLVMAYGLADPVDRIEITGATPEPIRFEILGGVPGDEGTARTMLSALDGLASLAPGLRTLLDLPGSVRGRW